MIPGVGAGDRVGPQERGGGGQFFFEHRNIFGTILENLLKITATRKDVACAKASTGSVDRSLLNSWFLAVVWDHNKRGQIFA